MAKEKETKPMANTVIGSSIVVDGEIVVDVTSTDNDSIGIPFRFKNPGDFYLALFTRDSTAGYPSGGAVTVGVMLGVRL